MLKSASFAGMLELAIKFGGLLVLLPLVLNVFGAGDVAIWLLFNAIFSFTQLLNIGLTPTVTRFVAYKQSDSISSNDSVVASEAILSSSATCLVSCVDQTFNRISWSAIIVLISLGTLVVLDPVGACSDQASGWLAWLVIVVSSSLQLRSGKYRAYLCGVNKVALVAQVGAALSLLSLVSGVVCLLLGGQLFALVLVSQLAVVIGYACFRHLALSTKEKVLWRPTSKIEKRVLANIMSASWRSITGVMFSHGVLLLTGMIVANVSDARESAAYLLAIRLIQGISSVSRVPFYVKLPHLAKLFIQADTDTIIDVARQRMLIANLLLVLGCISVYLFGETILTVIGADTGFVSNGVWAVFSMATIFERIGAMHLQMYTLSNDVVWHIANGLAGSLTLLLFPPMLYSIGILGIAITLLCSNMFFYAPYCYIKNQRLFKFSFWEMNFLPNVIPAALMCAVFLALGL